MRRAKANKRYEKHSAGWLTVESASVYFVTSVSGIFTGIGMIILLFVNVFRTVRGIQHMEDMRQQQELERKQKQTEEMTLQMMRTLAATIEGKDRNNCGHSIRVAEYAALIGKRLGLSSEEIENQDHPSNGWFALGL